MSEMRTDYISWDEYFMGVAILSSKRSKDPSTQVGACIASNENKVITMGYNGMPIGCDDSKMPWGKTNVNPLLNKYFYVCHAEFNAILNSNAPVRGCRLYVTLFPCNECAKAIIQSGISEVIYLEDKYKDSDSIKASKKLLDLAGITYRQYEGRVLTPEFEIRNDNA